MFVLGLGLGFVMQVLVLAVQNATEYEDLGVATSGATLFRSMGGTIGVAIFGAVFSNQLASHLAKNFPQGLPGGQIPSVPALVDKLPPAIHGPYISAFVDALHPVFLFAAAFAVVAFVLTWFLRELPLRQTVADKPVDPAFLADLFAAPRDETSLHELENKLSLVAKRENRHWVYQALADEADTDLNPQQLWLLFRVGEHGSATVPDLAERVGSDRERLTPEMRELIARGLIRLEGAEQGEEHIVFHTTPESDALLARIDAVRRKNLEDALAGWAPERHPEVIGMVDRLSAAFAAAAPA
jgi:DNA-binding MarR family transcriptional regulator